MSSLFRLVTHASLENPDLGDLEMSAGQFVAIGEGPDMLAQRVRGKLLWLRGEWYQDQRQGTPWLEMMGKGATDAQIRQTLRRLVESVPGVASVPSITIERSAGRTATIALEIQSDEGYTITVADLDLPYGVVK